MWLGGHFLRAPIESPSALSAAINTGTEAEAGVWAITIRAALEAEGEAQKALTLRFIATAS